ncbi:MAG: AAA family ATPase [Desulfomonilaceae bacterium]|nr:AAA family ATPase [Desulfomonilaceae bacterium]
MQIQEIFIESFGAARGMRIADLAPGLTVIVGENEAGKSTVLEFVRSVFYGFKRKGGANNVYEPSDGNLRKGRIVVRDATGSLLRIERLEKRGLREGELTIYDDAGNRLDSHLLTLPGLPSDRKSYESLFAFDLDGMRQLDREALRSKILSVALGSVSVNPLDVIDTLNNRLKRIAKCPPREGESLGSLQDRLKELDKRIRAGADAPERHSRLTVEFQDVESRRRDLADLIRSHEASLSRMNRLLRYEQEWMRLAAVEREMRSLQDSRSFPTAGVDRLDRELERLGEIGQSIEEAANKLNHLRGLKDNLDPDTKLAEHSAELHSLTREAGRLSETPRRIEKATADLARSGAVLDAEIAALGPEWDRGRVEAFEPSAAVEHEIRSLVDSWRSCREELGNLAARLDESEERCRLSRAKTGRIKSELMQLAPLCETYLPRESQRRLEQWKSNRHRISDLKDNLEEKAARLNHLSGVRRRIDEAGETLGNESSRFMSPIPFLLAIATVSFAAAAMLYAGWKSSDETSLLFFASGVALLLCIPFGIRWKTDGERRHAERIRREKESLALRASTITHEIAHTERSRRTLRVRIDELQRESEKIAQEVLGNANADRMDVLRAEYESHKAEQPVQRVRSLEAEYGTASEDLDIEESRAQELADKMEQAEERLGLLRSSWQSCLARVGLPDTVSPESALGLLTHIANAKVKLQRHMDREADLKAVRQEWEDFSQRAASFAHKIGHPPARGTSLPDQVDQWVRAEAETREILSVRESLNERIAEHEATLEALRLRSNETRDRIDGLFEAAGVNDEEAFRDRSERHAHLNALEHERTSLLAALSSGLGLSDTDEVHGLMSSQNWDANHAAAVEFQAALDALRHETESLANVSGKLGKEIEFLESEDRREQLLGEKQEVSARLNRLAQEWVALKIAATQLEKTLRVYETHKQPKVLEKASEIFRHITGDTYDRILFPLDDDQVKAERVDQSRVEERHLSRGTLEQVYLALRLAHLEILGAEEPMPVMMDDILVNFDPSRARRTASALAGFADRTATQVLFFTCHPAVADLFPASAERRELSRLN